MKDTKLRSFEWLRNLDASEIVEIDIEGEISSQSVVQTTPSTHDQTLKAQLDEVYLKLPKSIPKSIQPKETFQYDSVQKFPDWKSLCMELNITSQNSFEWLKNIDYETETNGILEATQNIISSSPCKGIYSGMLYWGCESLTENEWIPAIRSVYYMYMYNKIESFYVIFKRVSSIFCIEDNAPVVYISNPTTSLISNLKKLLNVPLTDVESTNMIKVKSKKKIPMIKIEGKSVEGFYRYLCGCTDSKIISPSAFLYGQLRCLNSVYNSEIFSPFESYQKLYRLSFAGNATRNMVASLCRVLEQTQGQFYIDLVQDISSKHLPGTVPSRIQRTNEGMYEFIN
jgi:hypothetical protein